VVNYPETPIDRTAFACQVEDKTQPVAFSLF